MPRSNCTARYSAKQMFPIVEAYERSEQSRKEFCQSRGLKLHTFAYWFHKYKKQGGDGVQCQVSAFVSLDIESPTEEGGLTLRYPNGIELVFTCLPPSSYLGQVPGLVQYLRDV